MSSESAKVMFIDQVHPVLQESLEALGYLCDDFTSKTAREIEVHIAEYQGVVIRSRFKFTKKLIDLGQQLKFIARSGSGLENIDLVYAQQKGIHCINSPEGNKDALAEHCIGMLLNLFNHLSRCDQEVKNGQWKREANRGIELKGKTVGLIGYGVMGKAFAERLSGFGVTVLAHDDHKKGFSSSLVKEAALHDIYMHSDIVSLHVNYRPENYHMVNQEFFAQFKKPVFFLNTARGKCLNTEALIEAINTGKVLGACLDVLEFESTSFEKVSKSFSNKFNETLKQLTNTNKVLLSPHVGGWTHESYYKLSEVLADKIKHL